ncbi:glycoside hydrolase family 16 domain protein [Teredinibacter turnerae T7901]|uniref:Glycoside hydrolase family 16 domain protein n=1 Tax=Teredinibacter turnerae (strain ATCC 39867 / T7901) TaxID=377629 RepID=C6AR03_TERTT|nr:glycoside hydrolase family 16 domain protein [Teredinibacter turnerae T7901]
MQNQQTPWFYKNKCLLAGLILSITAQNALAQNWNLIWSDEFNGSISSDWVFETGNGSGGWGNNELEYYRRENTTVENGMLVITARQENYGGFNYTSSRLKTQGKKSFRYGKIEARISTPSAAGTWPAFWMLGSNINNVGWPACGEIDVMEHVNDSPQIHGTLHWQDNNGNYASYGGNTSADVTGFHVYGIEWDENAIRWLVDGNQYHETNIAGGVNGTGEFHNEFFILLNLAIGGNWPGFNIDNTVFPAQMKVDWVRVYQREDNNGGGGGGTKDLPKTIEAETFSAMSGVQTETTSDTGGGENVGWIDNGDWLAYNAITIPATGDYTLEYRVASPGGG